MSQAFQVTVIIPAYNAAEFIDTAIQSALACPEVTEIIVVDDGSVDDTHAICRAAAENADGRIRIIQHPERANRGAAASRNLGISSVTTEWLAFLDADDVFRCSRFSLDREVLPGRPDVDGIYHGTLSGRPGMTRFRPIERVLPDQLLAAYLARRCVGPNHCAITVRTELARAIGGYPLRDLGEDNSFLCKLFARGVFIGGSLDEPLHEYRLRPVSLSMGMDGATQFREWIRKYALIWRTVAAETRCAVYRRAVASHLLAVIDGLMSDIPLATRVRRWPRSILTIAWRTLRNPSLVATREFWGAVVSTLGLPGRYRWKALYGRLPSASGQLRRHVGLDASVQSGIDAPAASGRG
jgi:glycosyltransferase involved in cell wall biosynthesis